MFNVRVVSTMGITGACGKIMRLGRTRRRHVGLGWPGSSRARGDRRRRPGPIDERLHGRKRIRGGGAGRPAVAMAGELRHDRPRAATAVGPLPLDPPSAGGGGAARGGAGTEEEEHGFGADELLHESVHA
ncbi:uncharacterized protein [Lolium perenne]|uniref:uncharacterized protein isoform X2 n=1 Tax=Lolium perenne TaxID=4522 RepID=UPI003A994C03